MKEAISLSRRQPTKETVKASEARKHWSKLLNRIHGGDVRVIVEKDGIPVAGVVSAADLERLSLLEAERERNFSVLDELREVFKDVPDGELEDEITKAVNAAREELRAERLAAQHRQE